MVLGWALINWVANERVSWALQGVNEVVVQEKGSKKCGVFVADAMAYGPAGIGWPWIAAPNWVSKMRKLGEQLENERGKRIKAMREQDEKVQKHGEKMKQEREKMAALAEKMMAANKKMTKIQEDAWKLVNEGGALRVDELPSAYLKAKAKI